MKRKPFLEVITTILHTSLSVGITEMNLDTVCKKLKIEDIEKHE